MSPCVSVLEFDLVGTVPLLFKGRVKFLKNTHQTAGNEDNTSLKSVRLHKQWVEISRFHHLI